MKAEPKQEKSFLCILRLVVKQMPHLEYWFQFEELLPIANSYLEYRSHIAAVKMRMFSILTWNCLKDKSCDVFCISFLWTDTFNKYCRLCS